MQPWRWVIVGVSLGLMVGVMALLVWGQERAKATEVAALARAAPGTSLSPRDSQPSVEAEPIDVSAIAEDAATVDAAPMACQVELDSKIRALLAGVDAGDAGWRPDSLDVQCLTFDEGDAAITWSFRPSEAGLDDPDTWRASFGPVRHASSSSGELDASYSVTTGLFTKLDHLDVTRLYDYDGDGAIEVLVRHETHFHEGHYESDMRVLTWKSGSIVDYGPASGFVIDSIEDVDGDGRPDFRTRGPYARVDGADHFGNTFPIAPVAFVAHSLSDGTFSMTDTVARKATAKVCPAKPKVAFTPQDLGYGWSGSATIVCARLWGVTQREIVAAIDATCADAGGDIEQCDDWGKRLATVVPPFAL